MWLLSQSFELLFERTSLCRADDLGCQANTQRANGFGASEALRYSGLNASFSQHLKRIRLRCLDYATEAV